MFAEFVEKYLPVTESRQQYQRAAAGVQAGTETGGESLCDVIRPPGAVAIVARRALYEWRVEQDQIESLIERRGEQISVPHVDLVLDVIQKRIDAGAANRGGVDVHRHNASRIPGGKHRTYAGTRAHIQYFPIALYEAGVDLRGKELTGARHFRIEHAGGDHKGHAVHPFQAKIVVSILSNESVAQSHRFAEKPRHQGQPRNPQRMPGGRGGSQLRGIKHRFSGLSS